MSLPDIVTIKDSESVERILFLLSCYGHSATIEQNGVPVGVVISPEAYEQYIRLRRAHWDRLFEEEDDPIAQMRVDEVEDLVQDEIEAVRRERAAERERALQPTGD